MDKYTAQEMAYKHGYEKGYEAAKKEAESEILILKQKRANIFEIANAYERGFDAAKAKWIPVSERLPEVASKHKHGRSRYTKSIRVLCACLQNDGKTMVKEGYYEHWNDYPEVWWKIPGTIDSVTHWMPLPEPPEEKADVKETV